MGHIMGALEMLENEVAIAIATSLAAQDAYNVQLQADLEKTVWGDPDCGASWYKTEEGYITQNWSGTVTAYQAAFGHVKREDYELIL